MRRLSPFNIVSLTLGFAFLYIPMLILIIYSFNESKLVTVWAGFSTRWYGELLRNEAFLDAAWVTLQVAFFSSTLATVLGTMAAYVLVRRGRFFGRTLFSGMIHGPVAAPVVHRYRIGPGRANDRAGSYDVFDVLRLGRGVVATDHIRRVAGGGRA